MRRVPWCCRALVACSAPVCVCCMNNLRVELAAWQVLGGGNGRAGSLSRPLAWSSSRPLHHAPLLVRFPVRWMTRTRISPRCCARWGRRRSGICGRWRAAKSVSSTHWTTTSRRRQRAGPRPPASPRLRLTHRPPFIKTNKASFIFVIAFAGCFQPTPLCGQADYVAGGKPQPNSVIPVRARLATTSITHICPPPPINHDDDSSEFETCATPEELNWP